ncbi:MAG: DUF2061 domain-containing protein [Pedosphaera sp.]|nr:DUF2061 domain-containing protein [Pedosphaera sp.]
MNTSQPETSTATAAQLAATQLKDSHLRSFIKAVSWRIIGTIDTMVISYLWTGHLGKAIAIGGTEVITKIFLYYMHERAWAQLPLGTMRKWFHRA